MKKIVSILAYSLLLTAISCSKNINEEDDQRKQSNIQHPITLAAPVANVFTDFSFDFFKALQSETEADKDIFVSPLSLHIALGMLVNGAEENTKQEIIRVLKAENLSQDDLNKAYNTLLKELPEADPLVKLAMANAIFYRQGFNVQAPFLNTMKNSFDAQVTGIPFNANGLETINKWASNNTNGKIPKVVDKLEANLVMLLMNALYFKGDWRSKFDKKNTNDQPFYLQNGSQKTVKMMMLEDTFRVAVDDDFVAVQLPYGNGQFRATFLLPDDGKPISGLLNNLDVSKWTDLQSHLLTSKIEVGLPKFKLEQDIDLKKTLKKMGMIEAFEPYEANLQGINKVETLYVDFVKQNTFAAVDEEGTEAAAVTTIGIGSASEAPPPRFICNKPFGLIISETTSNTILFMGRIMNPQQ